MIKYAILDLETDGTRTYKRFCNPLDPNHKIIVSSIKYYDQDDVELIYNEENFEEGVLPGEALGEILERCDIIVGQNIKFDMLWLWGYAPLQQWLLNGGTIFDTQTAEYLIDGQNPYSRRSLDDLARKYGADVKDNLIGKFYRGKFTQNPDKADKLDALYKKWGSKAPKKPYYTGRTLKSGKWKWSQAAKVSPKFMSEYKSLSDLPDYLEEITHASNVQILGLIHLAAACNGLRSSQIPKSLILPYAEGDAVNTEIIFLEQLKLIHTRSIGPLCDVYMRHYTVLIEMEYNGLKIDLERAERLVTEYQQKTQALQAQAQRIVLQETDWNADVLGPFQAASSEHCSLVLYGRSKEITLRRKKKKDNVIVVFKSGKNKGNPVMESYSEVFTFEGFGLTPSAAQIGKKQGTYSTGSEALTDLLSSSRTLDSVKDFCKVILEFRKAQKVLSTYLRAEKYNAKGEKVGVDGNLALVHSHTRSLHPEYHAAKTITGRLSSNNPNAQNFEKIAKSLVVSRFGDEGTLIQYDFSQLEIICQAFITQSQNFIKDIKNGVDFHCKKLSYTVPQTYEEVVALCATSDEWKEKRRKAKIISFRRAYGATEHSIAEAAGLPLEVVKDILEKEDAEYHEVQTFYDDLGEHLKLSSRATKETIPLKVKMNDGSARIDAERRVPRTRGEWDSITGKRYVFHSYTTLTRRGDHFNYYKPTEIKDYPVQGLAADIVATQVGELYQALRPYRAKCRLIAEVHDSILIDTHNDVRDLLIKTCHDILPNIQRTFKRYFGIDFNVPLAVDGEEGDNWADMETLTEKEVTHEK